MKELLEFVVKGILDKSDEVKITQEDEAGVTHLKLAVSEDEVGKIIGKKGKIIKAIKTMLKIKALKVGQKVYLELANEHQGR